MAYARIPSSDPAAGSITNAMLAAGAVTLAKLGVGMSYPLKLVFTANGSPGSADDVAIDFGALGIPAGTTWEHFDTIQAIESGGAASATGQIRTASGGAGSAVTTAMSAASNVDTRDAQAARVGGITSSTTWHYRRTGGAVPSGTAGHLTIWVTRTA